MTYYLPTGIMNSKIKHILMQSVESCIPNICCARHTPDMSAVFTRCATTMCLEIILNPAPCQPVAGEDLWNCADGRARRAAVTLEKLRVQLCHSSALRMAAGVGAWLEGQQQENGMAHWGAGRGGRGQRSAAGGGVPARDTGATSGAIADGTAHWAMRRGSVGRRRSRARIQKSSPEHTINSSSQRFAACYSHRLIVMLQVACWS